MSCCTCGLQGDVFSWDKPRKGDVLQLFSASLQKLQGDGWRKKQVWSFFRDITRIPGCPISNHIGCEMAVQS
jgi:hypothetical protein